MATAGDGVAAAGGGSKQDGVIATFTNIRVLGDAINSGTLVVLEEALHWRSTDGAQSIRIKAQDLSDHAAWYKFGNACQLWLTCVGLKKDQDGVGRSVRFAPFDQADASTFQELLQRMGRDLKTNRSLSCSGTNWGKLAIRKKDGVIRLRTDKKRTMLDIPLAGIAGVANPGKNDLEFTFHDDTNTGQEEETLVEMRLHIPPGFEVPRDESLEGEHTAAMLLRHAILQSTGLSGDSGDKALVSFPKKNCLFESPRGRYAVELFETYLRMEGSTYAPTVSYDKISRMFLLPRPSTTSAVSRFFFFIISLTEPLRIGHHRHQHLVLRLDSADYSCEIALTEEQRKQDRFKSLDLKWEQQPFQNVFTAVLRGISGGRVFGAGAFQSRHNHNAVRCSLKGHEGFFYPLRRSLFFLHKPATFFRYSDIHKVSVERFNEGGTTADLAIDLQQPGLQPESLSFTAIDQHEIEGLCKHFLSKDVKVVNMPQFGKRKVASYAEADVDDGDDEEDEDFEDAGSPDEEEDDDDDDEDGEAAAAAGSGSDDDDDDGGDDGDVGDDDGDDGDKADTKGSVGKKRAKPAKRAGNESAAKRSAGGSDDDDNDGELDLL